MITEKQITDTLSQICTEKFNLSPLLWTNENFTKPLTGAPWYFSGIDLTFLLFETEKYFNIRFSETDLICYGFSSIDKIRHTLMEKINN